MTETAAPARPSLAHLPEPVRLRVSVAESLGARWVSADHADGTLLAMSPDNDGFITKSMYVGGEGSWCLYTDYSDERKDLLPDYEHDPAAWGALMEAGRIEAVPIRSSDLWYAIWYRDDGTAGSTPSMLSLGRVVCSAFLAKHGVDSW